MLLIVSAALVKFLICYTVHLRINKPAMYMLYIAHTLLVLYFPMKFQKVNNCTLSSFEYLVLYVQ